jgi:hypothetical protein
MLNRFLLLCAALALGGCGWPTLNAPHEQQKTAQPRPLGAAPNREADEAGIDPGSVTIHQDDEDEAGIEPVRGTTTPP